MMQKIESFIDSQFESWHNEKIDGTKVKVNFVDQFAPITFGFFICQCHSRLSRIANVFGAKLRVLDPTAC